MEGAKANGLEDRVGSPTPGKEADVIMLRTDRINVLPVNDPIGAVVWGMDTSNVDSVGIGGKPMKRNGELVGIDLASVARQAEASRNHRRRGLRVPAAHHLKPSVLARRSRPIGRDLRAKTR